MEELLKTVGEDLMGAIGGTFPPEDFPSVEEMIDEMEESGQPFEDDAMISVCVINAQRIYEFMKSNT